ncbi:hypothetical protein K439DRAFT_1619262 [Ramaria rubella]|nr:hypothetical protein K439DRAFT_1619262 [Ramaria rubella]
MPETLSPEDAKDAAVRCKEILLEYEITEVEIAFRESIFTRFAAPLLSHGSVFSHFLPLQLLNYPSYSDQTADVCGTFTPALGLQIAPKAYPYLEGTGCLYLCEGGANDHVFLLPPAMLFSPLHQIIHLGSRAYQNALEAIMQEMQYKSLMKDDCKDRCESLGEAIAGEDTEKTTNRKELEDRSAEAEAYFVRVDEFHSNITRSWSAESRRIVEHIMYSPPISVSTGDKRFTEDWALVELDRNKFDWNNFQGNAIAIYHGTKFFDKFVKMYPDNETRANFNYPFDGLMKLRDFVKDGELLHPTLLDKNGEECIIVIKNGAATGLTLRRATGIESFVREYEDNAIYTTSMAIAVYAYGHKDGAFSEPGDSGAVVGDAHSRIVGMIVGGAGKNDLTDVTYVTPYHFLDECIKKVFPDSHLYPIPDQTPP